MFGFKKIEIPNNTTYMDMWNSLTETSFVVKDAAVYVRKVMNAINLYPEGPDKEAERRELARAQNRLICVIADYDGKWSDLKSYHITHYAEIQESRQASWNPDLLPTSHQLVRNAD